MHQVYVSVACFDATGAIIGGGEHYVDAIDPGQRVGFSTDGLLVSGAPARCEAFPSLSGASG
ncbi:FxLYD domain-containing protein [Frankia gtarii]|uniref:FxLYD domain-containing protein n=1 Tax=Frankia gtarii TaxID=2950102 RepID=UPI0021C06EE4|nr:FxLYD domain-containing protein [Frankia gtarii]